ncbi:MAG: hypothetical protein EBZ59_02195, partial [Planctomycetia bacterium]|nr:hypothetical protein [Planctomycetia bacterium]
MTSYRRRVAACLAALLPMAFTPAPAAAADRTVLAVVACDGYGDLKQQLAWLGNQIDNPGLAGMVESVLMLATQGKGLAGLDVKRPFGLVVTTDGRDVFGHGFVPVKDLDRLLDSLRGVTGPVDRSGDSRGIALPSGLRISITEKDGWAVLSPQDGGADAADPARLIGPLAERHSLAVEMFPSRMPEPVRARLKAALEQAAAVSAAQGQPMDADALVAAIDGLRDTETLLFGLAVEEGENRLVLENRTVAVPGSALAAGLAGDDAGQLTVATPATADGRPPAVRVYAAQSVPDEAGKQATDLLDALFERSLPAGGGDRGDQLARLLGGLLRETIVSMLASGAIDAAASVDTAANTDERSPGLPAITAGLRVQDGAALERQVKKLLDEGRKAPPGVAVDFDSDRVDAGGGSAANLHRITIDVGDPRAADSLGRSLELTLAVTPRYAFLLAGGDVKQRLAAVLEKNGRADPQAKPGATVQLAADRLLDYA